VVEEIDQIDTAVQIDMAVRCTATLKPIKYKFHVGDNWFISVSDELPFVDIRRWYQHGDGINLFPTLVGIVLTFSI